MQEKTDWTDQLEAIAHNLDEELKRTRERVINESAKVLQEAFGPIFETYPQVYRIAWNQRSEYNDEYYSSDFMIYARDELDEAHEDHITDLLDDLLNGPTGWVFATIFGDAEVSITPKGVQIS